VSATGPSVSIGFPATCYPRCRSALGVAHLFGISDTHRVIHGWSVLFRRQTLVARRRLLWAHPSEVSLPTIHPPFGLRRYQTPILRLPSRGLLDSYFGRMRTNGDTRVSVSRR